MKSRIRVTKMLALPVFTENKLKIDSNEIKNDKFSKTLKCTKKIKFKGDIKKQPNAL